MRAEDYEEAKRSAAALQLNLDLSAHALIVGVEIPRWDGGVKVSAGMLCEESAGFVSVPLLVSR